MFRSDADIEGRVEGRLEGRDNVFLLAWKSAQASEAIGWVSCAQWISVGGPADFSGSFGRARADNSPEWIKAAARWALWRWIWRR